jgi:hypothetical protein
MKELIADWRSLTTIPLGNISSIINSKWEKQLIGGLV